MYRPEIKHILCIKLVKYRDKYTEMHGQQNIKKYIIYIYIIILALNTTGTSVLKLKWRKILYLSTVTVRDTGRKLTACVAECVTLN